MKKTKSVLEVVRVLSNGGAAVIPTDTAYALAADATNPAAVLKVKKIKGRSRAKPIALIAASFAQVRTFFYLSNGEVRLARKYWPGPLTILLTPKAVLKKSKLSPNRIGVRIPKHPVARAIAAKLGRPITATSANQSKKTTPYTPAAAVKQFRRNKPDILFSAGPLPNRPVSTVVLLRRRRIILLRPGAISATLP